MSSVLRRKRQQLGRAFAHEYPRAWLVWEPGPWRPALSRDELDNRSTFPPAGPARPAGEDAICFQLPLQGPVSVGRGSSNDVLLNDLSASRRQLALELVDGAWKVRATGLGVSLQGEALLPGQTAILRDGDSIGLGDVRLTYLEPASFEQRLDGAEATPEDSRV